jgi:hypothetical protein
MKRYLHFVFAVLFISTLGNYDNVKEYDLTSLEKISQHYDSSLFNKKYFDFTGLQIKPYFGIGQPHNYVNLNLPFWKMSFETTGYMKKNSDSLFFSINGNKRVTEIFPSKFYQPEKENGVIFILKKNSLLILFFFYTIISSSILMHLLILRSIIFTAEDILNDKPFSSKILSRLKFCYIVSFFYPIINTVISYVTGAILLNAARNFVYFSLWQSFTTARIYWFIAFAFFCLYNAFKKGFLLKEEQSLTI